MAVIRTGEKWNREETILAFELYCRTPFGRISQYNHDVIELASLIGRTPGSVSLKMHNLAHFDPELKKRNISAMAHGSKLDEKVFNEFSNDWSGLSYLAQTIRAKIKKQPLTTLIDIGDVDRIPEGKYREQVMKARIGQYFFRRAVLNSYNNQCCITGLKRPELLIASHIKPWKDSDERTERTNPSNGLCLNAFHDKAFDRGFITLDKNYNIVISNRIKETDMDRETREWFCRYDQRRINLPDKFLPGRTFIEYHNDVVFQG